MAIRTFNSVGGFSVGEVPSNIILANGDILSNNITLLGNISANVGNITGNLTVGNIKTDHLLYANGLSWDLQQPAGANNQIQYNIGNNFAASSNLTYNDSTNIFGTINIDASGNIIGNIIRSNVLTNTRVTFASTSGQLSDNSNFTFDVTSNTLNVDNITTANNVTIGGNLIVQGTLTSIETSNTTITDNTVILNKGQVGATVSSGISGIEIDRGTGDHPTLYWTESSNAWVFTLGASAAEIHSGSLTVTGNANVSNNINVIGNIIANRITGNIFGNVDANITSPGSNQQVLFNDTTLVNAASGITYNKTSNLVTLSGDLSVANVTNLSSLIFSANSNITGGANSLAINATGADGNIQLTYTNAAFVSRILSDSTGVNVSVGTNNWTYNTTGDFSAPGNVYANTGLVNANLLFVTRTANIRGDVEFGGNVNIASQTNILGNVIIGNATHKSANVTGNLTVGDDATVVGNVSANNLQVGNYVASNLISTVDTYGLGSSSNRWKEVWLTNSGLHLGTANITAIDNTVYLPDANIANLSLANIIASGYANIGSALTVNGIINATNTTHSTNTTSGALIVNGGVGIGGNIYVGTAANIAGNLLVGTDSSNANANITGNLTVGKDTSVGGNLSITGNLLVSGTTTYINVTNIATVDPLIDIGGSGNGLDLVGPVTSDRGLLLRNYASLPMNQFIGWKTAANEFQLLNNVTMAWPPGSQVVNGDYANLHLETLIANNIQGTVITANQPNIANLIGVFNITVSNRVDANVANITTLTAGGLKYPTSDGSENQILKTDGHGNLLFATVDAFTILNGSSNVYISPSGNISMSVAGNSNILVVTGTGANITGTLKVSGNANLGNVESNVANITTLQLGNTSIQAKTTTTSSTSTNQVIAEISATGIRGVNFLVKGEEVAGEKYALASVSVVHNGTDVAYDVYGRVSLGGFVGKLSAGYSGGNIQLLVTPASSNSTVWTTQFRSV